MVQSEVSYLLSQKYSILAVVAISIIMSAKLHLPQSAAEPWQLCNDKYCNTAGSCCYAQANKHWQAVILSVKRPTNDNHSFRVLLPANVQYVQSWLSENKDGLFNRFYYLMVPPVFNELRKFSVLYSYWLFS